MPPHQIRSKTVTPRQLVLVRYFPRNLGACGITDEDIDDLVTCLDVFGREDLTSL